MTGATSPLPEGPRSPAFVQLAQFLYDLYGVLDRSKARYGDLFTLRLPGFSDAGPMVAVSAPRHLEQVFKAPPEVLCGGDANELFRAYLGDGSVLLMSGSRHRRERKLLMPPFHGERMRAYGEAIREITDQQVATLHVGDTVNIHKIAQRITLDVILTVVFGILDDKLRARMCALIEQGADLGSKPYLMLRWFQQPFGPWARFVKVRDQMDEIAYQMIERARSGAAGDDVLSLLAHAVDEEGQRMTPNELRDELRTLLVAGHETTATTIAWVFGHILRRADVMARIREEVRRVTGGDALSADNVGELRYLDAVIQEAMRLTPVAPLMGRLVRAPFVIDGFELPPNTMLGVALYLTHRRPETFEQPRKFAPERFLTRSYSPFEFAPWGGGRRRCIGAALASYEMRMAIAQLVRRVTLKPAPGSRLQAMRRGVTVAPKGGVPVVVEHVHRPVRVVTPHVTTDAAAE